MKFLHLINFCSYCSCLSQLNSCLIKCSKIILASFSSFSSESIPKKPKKAHISIPHLFMPSLLCTAIVLFFIFAEKDYSVNSELEHVCYSIWLTILSRYCEVFVVFKVIFYTFYQSLSCFLLINCISLFSVHVQF